MPTESETDIPESATTPTDHRRKSRPGSVKRSLHSVTEHPGYATCSCGWDTFHPRVKIRNRRVDAHVAEKHNGQALFL
jgi:hypothetical protein